MPRERKTDSITKSDARTAAGAELLLLCQSITEDGRLSSDEIRLLRDWVNQNWLCELPSAAFLKSLLQRILADGVVTAEERQALHEAVETVLPPELRRDARERRKTIERLEKAEKKVAAKAERELERYEAELRRPVTRHDFMVAGIHFEGRDEIVRSCVAAGDRVFLARDRANAFSRNAIEVRLENGLQVGFVPEDNARSLASLLDAGCTHIAHVKKILTGGRVPIPVVAADIFQADSPMEGVTREMDIPAKREYSPRHSTSASTARRGCLGLLLSPILLALL